MGDVISLLTPVFRGLREKYPKHKLSLITGNVYLGGALTDIANHTPFIDCIYPIEPYDATPLSTSQVWAKYYQNTPRIEDELIWKRAEQVFDLNVSCVQYEWPAMHTPEGITKPRYVIWCEAAGVKPSTYRPIYEVTKAEKAVAEDYFAERNWDADRCVAVATSCCDKRRALGHQKLYNICAGIRDLGYRPVIIDPTFKFPDMDSVNAKPVRELMPILERMRLAVSADSGLLHMAGTLGVPVIGLFGPTDAKMRMGEYTGSAIDPTKLVSCSPCWYTYDCTKNPNPAEHYKCLNKIGVDVVVQKIEQWLGKPRNMRGLRVY